MKKIQKMISVFVISGSLTVTGCANLFEPASDKTSDAALFEDAQKAIDKAEYDTAIKKFQAMSASYKTQTDVIESWAGALAGKCGLDFISYFTTLGTVSLTGSTIFKFFMQAWSQKMINPVYCTAAQVKMEEISTNPLLRTNGENLFMAILGMVKIGVYLRAYADTDGVGNLGDGIPDAAFNVCTNNSANFPDAALDEVITGMGLITSNLTYLTAALSAGSITNALATVNTACSVSPGACGKTDPTTITAADRDVFRDILKTDERYTNLPLGLGYCDPATVLVPTLCCP